MTSQYLRYVWTHTPNSTADCCQDNLFFLNFFFLRTTPTNTLNIFCDFWALPVGCTSSFDTEQITTSKANNYSISLFLRFREISAIPIKETVESLHFLTYRVSCDCLWSLQVRQRLSSWQNCSLSDYFVHSSFTLVFPVKTQLVTSTISISFSRRSPIFYYLPPSISFRKVTSLNIHTNTKSRKSFVALVKHRFDYGQPHSATVSLQASETTISTSSNQMATHYAFYFGRLIAIVWRSLLSFLILL